MFLVNWECLHNHFCFSLHLWLEVWVYSNLIRVCFWNRKHKHVQEEINFVCVCVAGYKMMHTKCAHSFLCYSCYLLLVECIKVDTSGLRTGSSVLTGEEKSEHPRPSELIGTLLCECSLKTHTNHLNCSIKVLNLVWLWNSHIDFHTWTVSPDIQTGSWLCWWSFIIIVKWPPPALSECEFTVCLTSSAVNGWLAPIAAVSPVLLEHSGMLQIMSRKEMCGGHPWDYQQQ